MDTLLPVSLTEEDYLEFCDLELLNRRAKRLAYIQGDIPVSLKHDLFLGHKSPVEAMNNERTVTLRGPGQQPVNTVSFTGCRNRGLNQIGCAGHAARPPASYAEAMVHQHPCMAVYQGGCPAMQVHGPCYCSCSQQFTQPGAWVGDTKQLPFHMAHHPTASAPSAEEIRDAPPAAPALDTSTATVTLTASTLHETEKRSSAEPKPVYGLIELGCKSRGFAPVPALLDHGSSLNWISWRLASEHGLIPNHADHEESYSPIETAAAEKGPGRRQLAIGCLKGTHKVMDSWLYGRQTRFSEFWVVSEDGLDLKEVIIGRGILRKYGEAPFLPESPSALPSATMPAQFVVDGRAARSAGESKVPASQKASKSTPMEEKLIIGEIQKQLEISVARERKSRRR